MSERISEITIVGQQKKSFTAVIKTSNCLDVRWKSFDRSEVENRATHFRVESRGQAHIGFIKNEDDLGKILSSHKFPVNMHFVVP